MTTRVNPPVATSAGRHALFGRLESEVKSYCRKFPAMFSRAKDCWLYDDAGATYLDFFSGAGSLNYGHNNPILKRDVIAYLEADGIVQSLDLHTEAKAAFLEAFEKHILVPRQLHYKLQFPGPTGANAVEAALKLARKVTGRESVVAFTNAFHGMSLGAMAVSATENRRSAAGVSLPNVSRMPFDGYFGASVDTLDYLERQLDDPASGIELPAAIIVETIQAEGGIRVASVAWLQRLAALAQRHGIVFIVDDIQVGCGRSGAFFSFERAGIVPDIVCLPMSLVLLKPELDIWKPGEHNGTFRGNNLAFVAARSALDAYWSDAAFMEQVAAKAALITERLRAMTADAGLGACEVRGIGFLQGICWEDISVARRVSALAFEQGLVVEVCGPKDEVIKLMPPLTITFEDLNEGLDRLARALQKAA